MSTLETERRRLRAQLTAALDEDEDPLAAYESFVKWTLTTYPKGVSDPDSGLLDLLQEATQKFKDDVSYKGDLRYLKLWALLARYVDKPAKVYESLVAGGIGSAYSLLYEEYANALEQEGRHAEADAIYRTGIKRQARPLERLKKRHREFQGRFSSASTSSIKPSTSSDTSHSLSSTDHNRYLPMLAPPAPGRRQEKLRFNLSLLFTQDGVEYSAPEARARSMGLLGKKWGPDPALRAASSSSSTMKVDFTGTKKGLSRKSMGIGGGPEPTVTINTKEALADVFGMYNSPEKTMRIAPGSKHAPVRRIEPSTPALPAIVKQTEKNENDENARVETGSHPFLDENINVARKENTTPGPAKFKPFVDDEPQLALRTPGQAKFTPFVDSEPQLQQKTPGTGTKFTPFVDASESQSQLQAYKTPDVPRRALSVKDTAVTPTPNPASFSRSKANGADIANGNALRPSALKPVLEEGGGVFSKVFTPAPAAPPAAPFVNPSASVKKPFKVFSRPPTQSDNENAGAVMPQVGAFRPYVDAEEIQEEPLESVHVDDQDEERGDFSGQEIASNTHLEAPHDEAYEDAEPYQVPLGGRFGEFNIMTPITERTFEFTMSTRGAPMTPTEYYDQSGVLLDKEQEAVEAAERLAAELKEEEEREEAFARLAAHQGEGGFNEDDESFASFDKQQELPPFRLSDGHTIDRGMAALEEKTGTLSLSDALTLVSSFKPANPCNPFDSHIISTLLSSIPPESGFHDLRDQEARQLEGLQKFAQKKARRASGNTSSSGARSDAGPFMVTIAGRRYSVSDKLGEGGFGAVFAAKDLSAKGVCDDEDEDFDEDDDEDEDGVSMVALKVVKPRNLWEFHVLRRMRAKLPPHLRPSVVLPHALYAFHDESFLVLDLSPQGTLLDVVNRASQAGVSQHGACLDELLVMFFTVELMRLLEGMHNAGFIHGDLKIDNCLLRLEDVPGGAAAWSGIYQPSGEDGWKYKGVRVIDFGRTIDTRLFPPGQTFIADWPIDARDCLEMRENRPWTFETDYFGLAGVIYCMLFGKYIESSSVTAETAPGGPQRYKVSIPFKRYWQNELWKRLFDVLLNPSLVRPDGSLPVCEELGEIRSEMEVWLQSNCNRTSNTLKGLLKKIERSVWDSR